MKWCCIAQVPKRKIRQDGETNLYELDTVVRYIQAWTKVFKCVCLKKKKFILYINSILILQYILRIYCTFSVDTYLSQGEACFVVDEEILKENEII